MNIEWKTSRKYTDVSYETADGSGKITINRPEVRNAFRPQTTSELMDAFAAAREQADHPVVVLARADLLAYGVHAQEELARHLVTQDADVLACMPIGGAEEAATL